MRSIRQSHTSASSSEDDAIDLGALVGALWRGKIFIAAVVFTALLLGGVYAYVLATPMYRSTAVVMLNNREEQQVVDLGSVMGGLGADSTIVNTEVEVLKSRILLGKVVDKLNLTDDPEFNSALAPPSLFSKLKSGAKYFVKQLVFRQPVPEASEASARIARERVIDALLASMSVRNITQSLVFQITVETQSAEKSALISDTLVDTYILNQLEVKFEATEQATSWLTERVTDLQASLEQAEEEVKNFRARTSLVSPEALEGLEVQVKDTRERIDNIQVEKSRAERRLSEFNAANSPEDRVEATGDLQLKRMLPRVSNPSIAAEFENRFNQLVARAETDIARQASQLDALRDSLQTLELQIEQQSQDLITLQQLTREAEASRLLYEYFLARLKETSAQQGIQQADSRLLSPAVVPRAASAPRKSLILAVSTVLGFLLGASLVLLKEARHRAFRNAELLEAATGYPVIGQVPLVPSKKRLDTISYLREKPSSASAEAIRNLRTSVMLSNVDAPPKVIMTSSSLSGEGKTTISLSLALNFSTMGKKVLLIEGDIRRRVFSQYLEKKQKSGIVSVLTGDKDFDDVVVHSELLNADVLLGDRGQANAADIFSSERFSNLLTELRTRYDLIIIDTPPVLLVPDARVIAQNADSIIFVVRWDDTQREYVLNALKEFESVGKAATGLVLNQISSKGMRRYGYSGAYGSYSNSGSQYYEN
ncbi:MULTISPECIES: GumC family protein [Salipiger]|uniref:non-specific protein-tyrosine kinase n=1 Tax=Salipiger profundus TaxID=1229727 RepID=A0A1U7DDK5_9RHOB|nr:MULTISPECIES: polysaccharide biosynthesis tyrosine autokinase [Salipiger]APX26241.1 capsular exopolysaccharide biosynthesis protein [Salipiger profundus]